MTATKLHREIASDIISALRDYPQEVASEVASDLIQMYKDADGLSNRDADVVIKLLWEMGL